MSSRRASVPVKTTGAVTFDSTDAQTVRPYKGLFVISLFVLSFADGRTYRASPTKGYSLSRYLFCHSLTDAQTERPYSGLFVISLFVLSFADGRSDRASLQRVTRGTVRPYISFFVSFFVYFSSVSILICVQPETSTCTAADSSSGSSSVRSRRGMISLMSSVVLIPGLVFIEKSGERLPR